MILGSLESAWGGVLIELFFARCYTCRRYDSPRANMGSNLKSAISLQRGPVDPKFQVEGVAPYQPFFFSENLAK